MKIRIKKSDLFSALVGLCAGAMAVSALAFPFWLESPKRSNPRDPKSGLSAWPTPYRTPTPYVAPSATPTDIGTFTSTPTPSATPTASPSSTISQTFTHSPTVTPYAGTPTHTPTASPSYTITVTFTLTPTPSASPTTAIYGGFEDHEGGSLVNPVSFGDTPSTVTGPTASSAQAHTGTYSAHLNVTSGGWGAGANWESNYLNGGPGGYIDFSGALTYQVWIWADKPVNFSLRWREGLTNGGDEENWVSGGLSHPGDSSWQLFVVDISTMTEDPYGGPASCAPSGTCNATGNNTKDLMDVNRVEVFVDSGVTDVNMYFDDIDFSTSGPPTPTPTASPTTFAGTPTFTVTPVPVDTRLYEDFDSAGTLASPGTPYGDAGSSITYSVVGTDFNSSPNSLELNVTSAGWGAGFDFWSNYGVPTIDANDATRLDFYIKTDQNISFSVRVRENGDEGVSEDNENWVSPNQNITASGSWQLVSIDMATFAEDAYGNGMCAPNCANFGSGDNIMQLNQISRFQIQFAAGAAGALVYLDDINFFVPSGTPTVGPTFTVSPTITPTPVACVPNGTFGKTAIGAFVNGALSAYPETSHYTLSAPGQVVSINVHTGAVTGDMQLMIYADGGGVPTTLLVQSAVFTPLANQWNQVPVPQTFLAAGEYWLAYQKQVSGTEVHFDAGTDGDAYFAFSGNTFGSPPANYNAGTTDNMQWSLFADVCQ